mgnify:FL=1
MKTIKEVMSVHEPFLPEKETLYTQQQVEKMLADYGGLVIDEAVIKMNERKYPDMEEEKNTERDGIWVCIGVLHELKKQIK